jgi:hypothetical protein
VEEQHINAVPLVADSEPSLPADKVKSLPSSMRKDSNPRKGQTLSDLLLAIGAGIKLYNVH